MNKQELTFLKQKYNVTPRKAQGQNFLLDMDVLADMVKASDLSKDETVLEIGPGFGVLTTALASRVQKVITVEQDNHLARAIEQLASQQKNITLYNEDIRTFHRAEAGLQDMQYSLVANLPYSISSWVFREFLEHAPRPRQLVVMVQLEVAQRLTARPGQMSVLAVAAQLFADVEIIRVVPKTSFSPQPKIDSAIVRLVLHDTLITPNPASFLSVVKSGFSAKRKKLSNNLKSRFSVDMETIERWFTQANIPLMARPQELSLTDWEALRSAID